MQDHYTKIDNRFIDEVMPILKGSELACCMAIFRKTAGWGKTNAALSIETISEITGIRRRQTIIELLHALEHKGIIESTKESGKTTVYGFCYYLKQSFKTSNEKRTSDTKNTSTENVTGTRNENRTSTSNKNRTGPSMYKEKRKKKKEKREKKADFYELNQKEIDTYIQSVIDYSGNIRNEHAYRKKLIGQFIKEDKATLLEFEAWIPSYQCKELENRHYGNYFEVVTDKGHFGGKLMSVWINEDNKPSFKLISQDGHTTKEYWFHNITGLENFLENGGNR